MSTLGVPPTTRPTPLQKQVALVIVAVLVASLAYTAYWIDQKKQPTETIVTVCEKLPEDGRHGIDYTVRTSEGTFLVVDQFKNGFKVPAKRVYRRLKINSVYQIKYNGLSISFLGRHHRLLSTKRVTTIQPASCT